MKAIRIKGKVTNVGGGNVGGKIGSNLPLRAPLAFGAMGLLGWNACIGTCLWLGPGVLVRLPPSSEAW